MANNQLPKFNADGGEVRLGIFDKKFTELRTYEDTQGRTVIVPTNNDEYIGCRLVVPFLTMAELSARFLKEHDLLTTEDHAIIEKEINLLRNEQRNLLCQKPTTT